MMTNIFYDFNSRAHNLSKLKIEIEFKDYDSKSLMESFISKPWNINNNNDNCAFSQIHLDTILLQLKHGNRFTIDSIF